VKRNSKRFNPTTWTEKLVPVVLGLLVLGLLVTLAVIVFSILGITPGW
jgi:hypothetical protein